MKLYDLCIVINHSKMEWNGKYAIIIEDSYPEYYLVEFWTFEPDNEVQMKSFLPSNLRLAAEDEVKEYQEKFKAYCDRNNKA